MFREHEEILHGEILKFSMLALIVNHYLPAIPVSSVVVLDYLHSSPDLRHLKENEFY